MQRSNLKGTKNGSHKKATEAKKINESLVANAISGTRLKRFRQHRDLTLLSYY